MGQVLHGSATTTEAVRRAIQNSQASLRVLAERHGINSYEYICKIFTSERQRFRLDPLHQMPGLNISPPLIKCSDRRFTAYIKPPPKPAEPT
jgi:hypothetical protein